MKVRRKADAIILSGGYSTRMTSHKAFLSFHTGMTVLEYLTQTYLRADVSKIIVVVNPRIEKQAEKVLEKISRDKRLVITVNPHPEHGRFSSVKLGLRMSSSEFCYLQNIDNPFVTGELLLAMKLAGSEGRYVVPSFKGKHGHPVLISRVIADHLLTVNNRSGNLRDELKLFVRESLECNEPGILANINTDKDYNRWAVFSNSDSKPMNEISK